MNDITRTSKTKLSDSISDADYLARLKSKCVIAESGCWEKQGFRRVPKGMEHHGRERAYGMMGYRGKTWAAHRLAWFLVNGPIPDGMKVLHKCDNPPCCNPDHMEIGDDKKNMQDAGKRKRWPRQYRDTCIHGHPRTPENILYHGREKKLKCKTCQIIRWRKQAGWPAEKLMAPLVPPGQRTDRRTFGRKSA